MNILITGGAGFIGSVIADRLSSEGYNSIILDNLQQGHKEAVLYKSALVLNDLCDIKALEKVFQSFKIDLVMHMAGETVVEYSTTDPKRFYQNNIIGGINLLNTALEYNVNKFVFSSSAAVYGVPQHIPIDEEHPKNPINAYGESKLVFERTLEWYRKAYGLKYISLRYFNAAGATERLGEDHRPETHLIPNILKAILNNGSISIFGNDYPTPDGTCMRDYIHVIDIAYAHILAMDKIDELCGKAYNLGTSQGYTVREVVEGAKNITGIDIKEEVCPRRPGDPPILVASPKRAISELGWKPECSDLETIIRSAWTWLKNHPNGYKDD